MRPTFEGHPALLVAKKELDRLNPDRFEIYFERKRTLTIESKNASVDSLTQADDAGVAIRVIKKQRPGFSFTTSLDPAAVENAARSACTIAEAMPKDPHAELFAFASAAYPALDCVDRTGLELPISEKIKKAIALETLCRNAHASIRGIRTAAIRENHFEIQMLDAGGEFLRHEGTLFTASVLCLAEKNSDHQAGSDARFSQDLSELEIEQTGRTAAERAVELLGAGAAPTMECPAVLRNNVVADLIGFLADSFSAEAISKGRSLLAGRMGEKIFSEKISLVDDGLLHGGAGTLPFDGEGVPSRKTTLVDAGQLTGILCDAYYAKKMNLKLTASARRGIQAPPSIGPSNLALQAGRASFEELIRGISQGVLITQMMGLHTANAVTGDFSVGASGILIEHGELTRPLRGFAIAGNILKLLQWVSQVGSDTRAFGGILTPSLRVENLAVGGSPS